MAIGSLACVVPRLRAIGLVPNGAGDAELLEQFVSRRDEVAFDALVRRHGPMVFAVCRRVLRHTQDAEDAFQATFLVLAHKAATVSPRNKLAGWLHGVAHNTARKARQRAARRSEVETRVPPRPPEEMHPDTNWDEVEPLLDQELTGLPDHYRLPIVMCDLEDRPRTEVARALGCSEGTLSSRLTRGRRILAERLKRRGVHLSAAAFTAFLTRRSVALTEPLIRATVPAALSVGANGTVPPSVADLATGVMKSMFLKKLRTATLAAFAVAGVALALTSGAYQGQAAPAPRSAPVPAADEKKTADTLADVEGRLLMNRKVLKDMKCNMDQFDRIMDVLEEASKVTNLKTIEAMGQLKVNAAGNPLNAEALNKAFQSALEVGEKEFRKATGTVVTDVLTPAQRKRFREIDLQARGAAAFMTPLVVKALDLTAKQREQFEANWTQIEEEVAGALRQPQVNGGAPVFRGGAGVGGVVVGGFDPADSEKRMRDAHAEGMKRALAVLTEEQKAGWKRLAGDPFTHPLPLWGVQFETRPFTVPLRPAAPAVPQPALPPNPPAPPAP